MLINRGFDGQELKRDRLLDTKTNYFKNITILKIVLPNTTDFF